MEPTPEQFEEWLRFAVRDGVAGKVGIVAGHVARLAYAAGADAELSMCIEWGILNCGIEKAESLCADRRPKPPSLKRQALRALDAVDDREARHQDVTMIRRALESLPDD